MKNLKSYFLIDFFALSIGSFGQYNFKKNLYYDGVTVYYDFITNYRNERLLILKVNNSNNYDVKCTYDYIEWKDKNTGKVLRRTEAGSFNVCKSCNDYYPVRKDFEFTTPKGFEGPLEFEFVIFNVKIN